MDPASIIGTTAATLQFLAFITKVAKGSASAKQVPADAKELRDTAARFEAVVEQLEKRLRGTNAVGFQIQLQKICSDCLAKARELHKATVTLVNKIEGGNVMTSVWEAIKKELGGGKLDEIAEKLAEYQSQLSTVTIMCLWEASQQNQNAIREIGTQVSELHTLMLSFREPYSAVSSDRAVIRLASSNSDLADIPWNTKGLSATRDQIMDVLIDCDWDPEPLEPGLDDISSQVRLARRITLSLKLQNSRQRHDRIPEPYEATLEWIWDRSPKLFDDQPKWSSFPAWLETKDQSIYWITGRPGSGKSTLMRSIEDHEVKLKDHLAHWSAGLPLHIWSFYAWNPGSVVEKSIDGLVRSILDQALRAMPHLTPIVAPRRWTFETTLPGAYYPQSWENEDTKKYEEALFRVLVACQSRARLLILVDGLDEFDVAPKKLIQLIQRMAMQGTAKLCVASRPWTEFLDHFQARATPRLTVHEVTESDIEKFVVGRFEESPTYKTRRLEVSHLQREVIEAAQGVFQWVVVVVNYLVEQLEAGDSYDTLQSVVEQLPTELADLYSNIWDRISRQRRAEGEQIFELVLASKDVKGLHLVTVWTVSERKTTQLHHLKETAKDAGGIRDIVGRRLGSRTLGLLEIDSDDMVSYFHRTVPEWVVERMTPSRPSLELHYDIIEGLCTLSSIFDFADLKVWSADEMLLTVMGHMRYLVEELDPGPNTKRKVIHWLSQLEKHYPVDLYPSFAFTTPQASSIHSIHPSDFTEILAIIGYEPALQERLRGDMSKRRNLYLCCLYGYLFLGDATPRTPFAVSLRLTELCLKNGAMPSWTQGWELEVCSYEEAAVEVRWQAATPDYRTDEREYLTQVGKLLDSMPAWNRSRDSSPSLWRKMKTKWKS